MARATMHAKVLIFEDPFTRTRPEGKAELLKRVHRERFAPKKYEERWSVRFEDGDIRERVLITDDGGYIFEQPEGMEIVRAGKS